MNKRIRKIEAIFMVLVLAISVFQIDIPVYSVFRYE